MIIKISIFRWILLVIMLKFSFGQRSPCPNSFTYDANNSTAGTWFATIHLYSNVVLNGIFVDIIFDKKAESVGTFFLEVTTKDSVEFHIEDRNLKIKSGETVDLKFYVKYNKTTKAPLIKEIRLNGQNICKSSTFKAATTTTTSPLFFVRLEHDSQSYETNNDNYNKHNNNLLTSNIPNLEILDGKSRVEERTRIPLNSFQSKESLNENSYHSSTTPSSYKTTQRNQYFSGDLAYVTSERNINFQIEKIPSAVEQCGTIIPKSNPLIISGKESYKGQFPWHAALYISTGSELKYVCAGSLITKNSIITAGHCVTLKGTNLPITIDALLVYLGKYNLRKWSGPEKDVKILKILIHPNYDNERFFSDIALVKFQTNIEFTDYIRPICLWNFNNDLKTIINTIGIVPGWGYNEHGLISEDLSYIEMPIVSHETCIWSDRDFFSRITSDYSFCAGFKNGSSVCNGDSGGGLIIKEKNNWYLRGIVSVSIALQNHFLCDPKHYAVFTDVAKFTTWINNNI